MNKIDIINKFFIVRNGLEKYANEYIFKEVNLTASLYSVLIAISKGDYEIHKIFNEAPASSSQKIQKLEKLGYIKRKINTLDKRRWIFILTKKGTNVFKTINIKRSSGKLLDVFTKTTQKDLSTFEQVLDEMATVLNNNLKK